MTRLFPQTRIHPKFANQTGVASTHVAECCAFFAGQLHGSNVEREYCARKLRGAFGASFRRTWRMRMAFDVDGIKVASPCNARWNDMSGDERARFCGHCQKNVYNLSAMTRMQIDALIREKEGKFCGRFYQRADGRMLTADCPSRLRRMRERLASIGGALCGLLLSLAGCSPRQTSPAPNHSTGQVLMGDVALPASVCVTNSTPEIMGRIASPMPQMSANPDTPVRMGEIALPSTSSKPAK